MVTREARILAALVEFDNEWYHEMSGEMQPCWNDLSQLIRSELEASGWEPGDLGRIEEGDIEFEPSNEELHSHD